MTGFDEVLVVMVEQAYRQHGGVGEDHDDHKPFEAGHHR